MIRNVAALCMGLSLLCSGCRGGLFSPNPSLMDRAEDLAREQRYDEAIALYQKHMQFRLSVKDRPDWEDPYLYLLTIGDLELRRGRVAEALSIYERAEKEGVSAPLVSDRYRGVAEYYEAKHELDHAVEILKKYRARDPLLYDGMLDRLSKQIVAEEDAGAATASHK